MYLAQIYMILRRFIWIYVDLYAFWCVSMSFLRVYGLGVAYKRAAGAFSRQKKAFPDLLTM